MKIQIDNIMIDSTSLTIVITSLFRQPHKDLKIRICSSVIPLGGQPQEMSDPSEKISTRTTNENKRF